MSKESQNKLEQEKGKMPIFLFPLSKDEQKVESAYNSNLAKMFAILGDHNYSPLKTVKGDQMSQLIDELFEEEAKAKKEEIKQGIKSLLVKKTDFDKTIEQETRKFQSTIMSKKKEFNQEVNNVLNKVSGLDEMKANFLKSLNVKEEVEISDDDNKEEVEE